MTIGVAMSEKRTIAAKLQQLYSTVHPADRGPYSYREVADGIAHHPGAMTAQYLGQLMSGKVEHPKVHYLEALAEFYGVPVSYFFDEEVADRVDEQIGAIATWRDSEVRAIAERFAELGPRDRSTVTNLIDSLRSYQEQPRDQRRRRKSSS